MLRFARANWPLVLAVLCVWIARWSAAAPAATARLDPSYMQCMAYALTHSLQYARDIAFTYGPMGYFANSPYEPDLYWAKTLLWEFAAKLAMAGFLALAGLSLRSTVEKVVFFVALCVPDTGLDAYFFLTLLAMARWAIDRADRPALSVLPAVLLTILIGLVKFTYFVLAGATCLAMIASFARGRSLRSGAALFALCLAVFVGVWMALGQSPVNIPSYLATSIALAGSFSETMSRPAPASHLAFGLAVACATAAVILLHAYAGRRSFGRSAFVCVLLFALFIAFKAGFVRSMGNQITLFGFCAVAPFLMARERDEDPGAATRGFASRMLAPARFACTAASLCGFAFVSGMGLDAPVRIVSRWKTACLENAREIASPWALRAQRERGLAERRARFDLPRVRAKVGSQTVDNFHSEHGVVFLNRLNWRPRPIDHAYSVMTPELERENVRFLESQEAAAFMLFSSGMIDGRLPNMEDAGSLAVILRDYRPLFAEESFILFERDPHAPLPVPEGRTVLLERELAFGESLELDPLDGRVHLMTVDIRPTLAGRLRKIVYSLPPIWVDVETTEGATGTFRIVPGMLGSGAMVTPWLLDTEAWQRWLRGDDPARIVRLKFVEPEPAGFFEPRFRVKVVRADDLVPHASPELAEELRYSMFKTAPQSVEAPFEPRRMLYRGRMEVLVVHPPSEMRFELEPGRYTLRGEYGLLPEAYIEGQTDGATFSVTLDEGGEQKQSLLDRTLDPKRVLADRPPQMLALPFEARQHARLVLATGPGPAQDGERDWTYWTRIHIERDEND